MRELLAHLTGAISEGVAAMLFVAAGMIYTAFAIALRARLNALYARGGVSSPSPAFITTNQLRNWAGLAALFFGGHARASGDGLAKFYVAVARWAFLLMVLFGALTMYLSIAHGSS